MRMMMIDVNETEMRDADPDKNFTGTPFSKIYNHLKHPTKLFS